MNRSKYIEENYKMERKNADYTNQKNKSGIIGLFSLDRFNCVCGEKKQYFTF